ncbi:MAG: BON domain-containing protein [Acidobacteria bacterium]|nr:BON domain-containing protein [Acidobacteriota bacterium]
MIRKTLCSSLTGAVLAILVIGGASFGFTERASNGGHLLARTSDAEIVRTIRHRLRRLVNKSLAESVQIGSKDGHVTLRGYVPRGKTRQVIVRAAVTTRGVKKVISRFGPLWHIESCYPGQTVCPNGRCTYGSCSGGGGGGNTHHKGGNPPN